MRNESIEKTFHSAQFLVGDLQACLSDATAVEALVVLPLIERAANLKSDVSALYEANEQEAPSPALVSLREMLDALDDGSNEPTLVRARVAAGRAS